MSPNIERIAIILDENPVLSTPEVSPEAQRVINDIVRRASEANKIRQEQKSAIQAKKSADDRRVRATVIEILESIHGVEPSIILANMESDNLGSSIVKIKAYLKRDNTYTLGRARKDGKTLYYLDPVR